MTRTVAALGLWLLNQQMNPPAEKPRIELFWSDYKLLANKLPGGAKKALEKVAQAIFAEAGIELSFFVGSPEDHGKSGSNAVRIILMPRSAEGWSLPSEAMGASLGKNAGARTVYIFVPVVERMLGYAVDEKMLHDGRKAMALARALARVLAHEIIHAINPDIPHGPEGSLMTETLTRELLLQHRLSFHETTTRQLLQSLPGTCSPAR